MPRRPYPKDIELKIPNEVSDRGFSTEKRYAAAQVILEHWPKVKEFQKLADIEHPDYDDTGGESHFSNVWWDYFGPKETPDPRDQELTFGDLKEKYGSLKEWRKHEREFERRQSSIGGGVALDDGAIDRVAMMAGIDIEDDHDRELFYLGIKFGVEMSSILGATNE